MRTSLIRYIGTQQRWYVNALVNTGCADGTTYLTDKEIIPLETVIDDLQSPGMYVDGELISENVTVNGQHVSGKRETTVEDIFSDELGVRRG